jgi:hypothetical protein
MSAAGRHINAAGKNPLAMLGFVSAAAAGTRQVLG